MAIWNDALVHGTLDVIDRYRISPHQYNLASYDKLTKALTLGDENNATTTLCGNRIICNTRISSLKYTGCLSDGTEPNVVSFSDDKVLLSSHDKSLVIQDKETIVSSGKVYLGEINEDIYEGMVLKKTINSEGDMYKEIHFGNDYINTVIKGSNICVSNVPNQNTVYGTGAPPEEAIEGQIYFKLIS